MSLSVIATVAGILGISIKELHDYYKEFLEDDKKKFTDANRTARRLSFAEVTSRGLHTRLLLQLYDGLANTDLAPFTVHVDDEIVRTTIVGRPKELTCRIALTDNEHPKLITRDCPGPQLNAKLTARMLADAELFGQVLWDQGIYRLTSIELGSDRVQATFSLDRFLRYRLGIGALFDELLNALWEHDNDIHKILSNREAHLPLRSQFLPDTRAIAAFPDRMCAGGIHLTIAMLRPGLHDDYAIPIQRRSWSVSDGGSMLSVFLQAFHQPTIDPRQEMQLKNTFYRELYEELFGGEEAVSGTRRLRHDWYVGESPEVQWLQKNDDRWRLILTGLGYNLTTGNYEFALFCLIHDHAFWEHFSHKMVGNWESVTEEAPLVSSKDTHRLREVLLAPECTGSGVFSLSRALEYLNEHEPTKVKSPAIKCSTE